MSAILTAEVQRLRTAVAAATKTLNVVLHVTGNSNETGNQGERARGFADSAARESKRLFVELTAAARAAEDVCGAAHALLIPCPDPLVTPQEWADALGGHALYGGHPFGSAHAARIGNAMRKVGIAGA